jgi:fused signal recognition particle receptor
MAFFSKLKERLFKSSSKIEEGLDAIVAEGGVADSPEPREVPPAPEPTPAPEPAPIPEPEPEREPVPAPEPVPEPLPVPEPPPETPGEPRREPEIPPAPRPEPPRQPEPPTVPEPPREVPEAPPAEIPQWDEPASDPVPQEVPPPMMAAAAPAAARPGFLGRLFGRTEQKTVLRRELDDAMLEQLEELLIAADMGVDTAMRVTANIAEGRMGRKLSATEIKEILAAEIARIMEPVARPLPLYPRKPQVVLVVGVNGSGKTTTIGKLASQFRAAGKKVVIAAGDTFRAAAVEQLQVWGERAGVPVLTAPEGSDPASLAFDAMTKAEADGADLLLIDTAGRLQNRQDLMEELAKIVRVIRKKDPDAPHNTLLVLDATTGQNALSQVEIFRKLSDVSGLVMTKLDGTAKGGVLVALADRFGLPIHAIGVGEQIDDLAPFDPEEFARALTGLDAAA